MGTATAEGSTPAVEADTNDVPKKEPTAGELAIARILASYAAKDYFRHVVEGMQCKVYVTDLMLHSLLQLPEPEADELGRPTWSCSAQDVSRAYRRISVQVHPDKHPGNVEARDAFEALKATHKILTERGTLVREL